MSDERIRTPKIKAALPARLLPIGFTRTRCARCHSNNYFDGNRCTLCGSHFNMTRRWVAMLGTYFVLAWLLDPNRSWMRQTFPHVVLPWALNLGPITDISIWTLLFLFGQNYPVFVYPFVLTELAILLLVIQKFHGLPEMILKRLATIVVRIVRVGGKNAKYRGWAMLWSMAGFVGVVMLTLLGVGPIAKLHLTHQPVAFRWTVTLVVAVLVARLHPLRLLAELEWAIVKPLRFYLLGGWLGFRRLVSPYLAKADLFNGYKKISYVDRNKQRLPVNGVNVFVLQQRAPRQKASTAR